MEANDSREALRNAFILSASRAVIGSAPPIAISLGALAGHYLLGPDKSLVTAPVTGFNIGIAVAALPAAGLMRMIGRKAGFLSGAMVTAAGGALAAVALFAHSFWLFVLGLMVIGAGNAFVQQYRFAAADSVPPDLRAKAISWVLAGGVFSAVIGPQAVIWTRSLLQPVMFAGAFVAVIGLAAIGALILSLLRLPHDAVAAHAAADGEAARPLGRILLQPRFMVAFFCGTASYALMSFVMTGAPLAIVGCGFSTDQAALGISWHVLAMYGPSFFTGAVIGRFGAERVVAFGLLLLLGCAALALSGIALWQFWGALVLLGAGWNFAFIGATAMLTETYRPSEKNKVQGVHDCMLFASVAFASLMAGQVYNAFGWAMLNWIVFPVVAVCLLSIGLLFVSGKVRTA